MWEKEAISMDCIEAYKRIAFRNWLWYNFSPVQIDKLEFNIYEMTILSVFHQRHELFSFLW